LGLKVQHSLRAFTAKDRKAIAKAAENYPISEFYETKQVITAMGTGEALVTALSEKGLPTPLAHTLIRPPLSRMDVLTDEEIDQVVRQSQLVSKYNETIDRESALEILNKKIDLAEKDALERNPTENKPTSSKNREEDSFME